eukprot:TRINITY_DN14226_c0_g2_i5.p3 TRINITY_DN14226_c0_g2~~TRINITY_DN14226_c0_g2_i5.p3  ORF type:complete len:152 (+),score=19.30 TRINITY_DN14226_c0_g2_i5:240-695(+)
MYDIRTVFSEDNESSCRSSFRGCPPLSLASQETSVSKHICVNGKIDYLREEREKKQLAERSEEIGRQLQSLWMNDSQEVLEEKHIKLLVKECLRQQEAASQRQSKQNSCAQSEISEIPNVKATDMGQFQSSGIGVLPPINPSKLQQLSSIG